VNDAELAEAGPAFAEILDIMGPYLEGFRLYHVLKKLKFPGYVRDFAVRFGDDSTGDPAAWVWLIVSDDSDINDYFGRSRPFTSSSRKPCGVPERIACCTSVSLGSEQFDDIETEQLDDFARGLAGRHEPPPRSLGAGRAPAVAREEKAQAGQPAACGFGRILRPLPSPDRRSHRPHHAGWGSPRLSLARRAHVRACGVEEGLRGILLGSHQALTGGR
jgi:hypothetical protein